MSSERITVPVLGTRIDVITWDAALSRLMGWARLRSSRYVAVCNVHVVVTAVQDATYSVLINDSDMATPDGAPVAWMLRRHGFAKQRRVTGPDLMWALCERCATEGIPIYCYGSTEVTLGRLKERFSASLPELQFTMEAPPFRALSEEEDSSAVARINGSRAGIVFVGLGCPKQEQWMAAHRGRVNAVMLGVGAAFDFHAGTVRRAPLWMRASGLEWVHRLIQEPRRLWKRYLITNSLFMVLAARQLLKKR